MSLDLNTVELVSTLRTAPLNGSPSSTDYNETLRENLSDLASLAGALNGTYLGLVNSLAAAALQPPTSPVGIEGRTVFSDTSDTSSLFFDGLNSQPLTVADSLRLLNAMLVNFRSQLTDVGLEVDSLQARLASTNQNDISLALQSLRLTLDQLTANQTSQGLSITEILNTTVKTQAAHVTSGSIAAGATVGSYVTVDVNWPLAFIDNNYTAVVSLEDPNQQLYLVSYVKQASGVGLTLSLGNNDSGSAHTGTVHAIGSHA